MFLTISNLPPNIKVESLKKIIKEQCYVENMLVDNLKCHGKKGKSVTVGFMDKIEASVVLAKMDGYFLDGYKLTVRVVQQKTKQPEPTTSNPMVQPSPMSLKSPLPVHQFAPLFPAGVGLPSAPLFPSANAGLRPPAPVFPAPGLPSAPPLHLAVPSKQTPSETVAVAPNPVPLPPNPVASLSKNVNKTPPVKFKLTPPAEKQSSISSMPYYAIRQSASEDNLPTKNKPSQGSSNSSEKTRRHRPRSKSRSPPKRSSSRRKSRSPIRGRALLVDGLEVSRDQSSRYDRKHDRFVNRYDHGRFDRDRFDRGRFDRDRFEHGRRSPDRQRGHFSDRDRYEDRKRQFDGQWHHRNHSYRTERFEKRKRTRSPKSDEEDFIDRKRDRRRSRPYSHERLDKRKMTRSPKSEDDFIDPKRDMRCSRSNSNERSDKRKRYESPISDDVDLIYQDLDLRRSRSFSGDREYSRKGTESPVAVRAEENVAPVIPQSYFDPSNSYGIHPNTEPTVNPYYNLNTHSNIDPYSLSSAVPNPCAPVDGSVPSQTYYQPPGLYPTYPYTTHPTNQAATNALYPINSNFQVGVPFNPAIQNPISPYPNNPFLQTRFVPPPQNVTRPNTNLPIHTNIRTRFNPPSQTRTTFVKTIPINENIPTEPAPTPQKITTNKIVPSSANTQPNSDAPPQSSTTLNDDVPSGMKTQPRAVPPLQSSTAQDNVPSGMKTQPRSVPQSQNSTTLNDNVPSSANTQPRSVMPPQSSTTLNDNVPTSANTQPNSDQPSQNSTTLSDNVPSSSKTQPRSVPPSQNSTTLNDNVPSSAKTQPRAVPPLQSSAAQDNVPSGMKTQPRSVPQSQNSTTLNDNVPSSANTQPRSVMPPQSSTTLNDNVPTSANTQPNSDQPSQNSTTLSDNVPSSSKTQPRSVPPSQNSTTLNDNVPSSAKTQPKSVLPPQNSTTLNKNVPSSTKTNLRSDPPMRNFITLSDNNVPSSANTQPDCVTQFKSNRKVVELKEVLSQTTSYNTIKWALPNLVIKELFNLYSITYLPNALFKQIKTVYSNRVQEAIRPGLTGKEIYEYYKSLYPYSNEKLVLEGLIGKKLTTLKEDKPDPEPVKPVQPYRIKFNGVDRDLIYENALDEELKALELSFQEACRPSNDPDTDKLCTLLKRKGVEDFFKRFRMQMLKLSYEKSVFLLRMNYNKSEPSLSSLTKFLKSKNMEMINHNKKAKFILVRCETKKDFLKMQTCKLIYIDDCALSIRNCKSIDAKYNFEEFLNNASSSIKIEKDDISGELDDDETRVLNMSTKRINDFNEIKVIEPATPKDKEFDNTVPKKSDKVNTQYFDMVSTVDIKCENSMEEYHELTEPSEQKNTQHTVESRTQDNAGSDIPMADCANLLLTALDNETAQRIIESHTSHVESDTLMSNVVPTLADEVKQVTKCVEDCTNESPAILEPEIPQCIVESHKDNNDFYKPLKEQVDVIIDEAKLEDTKCIKESNNAENQCDTHEEEYVNKLLTEIKSEDIQCNEESNKNSYECGKPLEESINIFTKVEQSERLVARPVINPLDGIEGNAQCIKREQEFNNKCNTVTNKPTEEHNMIVPLAELESENYSHIEESIIKCDPDGLVNVRVTVLEPGNIQFFKEAQKEDPIADEYVKDPSVELESENTPCVKEKENTLEERVDAHANFIPTKGIKESPNSLEELNNKECVEYINAQNKYDTNLEELKNPNVKLEPEIAECVDESSNRQNCANIESDYTDDQIANTLAEIEECLQNSSFDFDNLDDFNEMGEYKEKSEMLKANDNENLTTAAVEDENLEDF